jgi:hypothetical protein
VDNDPIVHVHADALLTGTEITSIVLADLREPEAILSHPQIRELVDFTEPVALLLIAILHFITDEEAQPRSSRHSATPLRPAAASRCPTRPAISAGKRRPGRPLCTTRRRPRSRSAATGRWQPFSTASRSSTQVWSSFRYGGRTASRLGI